MRQFVLDTETTGLSAASGHRIIEIGIIEIVNRQIIDGHFHYYLNPKRAIDIGAQQTHGITEEFLADKPLFGDIADELLEFINNAEVIMHNAPFDTGFINHELALLGEPIRTLDTHCKITDSLTMARRKHPGQKNNLDALCNRYHIDKSKRTLHGAVLDAELTAKVYLAMTGGQRHLFSNQNPSAERYIKKSSLLINQTRIKKYDLPVIKANPQELANHEKQLNHIQQLSNNACVWLNNTSKDENDAH